jgi:hypothetical protein
MRSQILTLALLLPAGVLHAQGSVLLQGVEILDPSLTATVTMSQQAGDCQAPGVELWQAPMATLACTLWGSSLGTATLADGSIVKWVQDAQNVDPTCIQSSDEPRRSVRIFATRTDKTTRELVRIDTYRALQCGPAGVTQRLSGDARITIDLTNGLMLIGMDRTLSELQAGTWFDVHDAGFITIGGLPTMFDTLLTFIPGGQSLSLLTPTHPDGFRSADSLQVWTGDVRTLPDWSQAQPLTCEATVTPTPGQQVTIADTLPNPAVGHGRYYLTASVNGSDRRLGRQYLNGAFSARNPASLPVCE